jgi:hypothetical protein
LAVFISKLPTNSFTNFLIKLLIVLVAGELITWLLAGLVIFLFRAARRRGVSARWPVAYRGAFAVFAVGLGFGLVGSLEVFLLGGFSWDIGSYVPLILFALALGLKFGLGASTPDSADPLSPYASWVRYRLISLSIWFVFGGLAEGFLLRGGIRFWFQIENHASWLAIAVIPLLGLVFGIVLGAIYPETWTTSLACAQLAIRQRTPIQLIQFLDDARDRDVLRTVGPVYQFRHARLQDHLAKQVTTNSTRTMSAGKTSRTPSEHRPLKR